MEGAVCERPFFLEGSGVSRESPAAGKTPSGALLGSGTVQHCLGNALLVCGTCGLVRAVRADGCLLAPEAGDTVLLALLDSGEAWVLSVLRKKTGQGEVRLPESSSIHAESLKIQAAHIDLGGKIIGLAADRIALRGRAVSLCATALLLRGRHMAQRFASIRSRAGRVLEAIALWRGQYGTVRQEVDELSEVQAERMRLSCRKTFRLRAETGDIKARKHMDIDAENIRIG